MAASLVYAYPWDFEGDDGAGERAATLGVDGVAVAASYHATRAARPMHPSLPLVDVEHAACYVPVRASAWAGRRLVPRQPTWVASTDSFGLAGRRVREVGLQTHAWVVLTHNSDLGGANPDLVVRNAFGTRYSYALCPSATDVVEYCATLVDEVLRAGAVDGLVLEACGSMGVEHNGLHEKTSLAGWNRAQHDLLSLCFCAACTKRYADEGLDVSRLLELVRRAVTTVPESVEQALGADLAAALRAVRNGVTAELRRLLAQQVKGSHPDVRVTLHAAAQPWTTGSFATVSPRLDAPVDTLVGQCFEPGSVQGLAALRELSGGRTGLGAFVRPTDDWADESVLYERMADYRRAGMDELHLYHLGLVGPGGLHTLRRISEAFRQSA